MSMSFYDYRSVKLPEPKAPSPGEAKGAPEASKGFGSAIASRNIHLAKGVDKAFFRGDVDAEHDRNNHVLVVGGSGAGKTRAYVVPNILSGRDVNLVVIDPKGEGFKMCADQLRKRGYTVWCINTINPERSCGFDPLAYVSGPEDLATMGDMLSSIGVQGSDRFTDYYWLSQKKAAIKATLQLQFELEGKDGAFAPGADPEAPHKYLRMNRFLDLVDLMPAPGGDSYSKGTTSPLDKVFEVVSEGGSLCEFEKSELSDALVEWSPLKDMADKTYSCVVGDVTASLSPLSSPEMRVIYDREGLRLDKLDEGKQALFIIKSDNDSSRDSLTNLAIKILLNRLQRKADASETGMLERPVEFYLDEFANIGRIVDFERMISTARSRGINFHVIVQAMSQLESVYGGDAGTIIKNCDTFLYMGGGSSVADDQFVSNLCGTVEVATTRVGVEHVRVPIERPAITASQIGQMSRGKCVVKFSNAKPIIADKLDIFGADAPSSER